jgi:chromosome partitioning protein
MMVATAGLGWPPQAYPNGLPVMGGFVPARPATGNDGHRSDGNGAAPGVVGLGWPAIAVPVSAVPVSAVPASAVPASAVPGGQRADSRPPPARLREVLSGVSRETVAGGQAAAGAPATNRQAPAHGGAPGYPYPDGPASGVTAPMMAVPRPTDGNSEDEPGESEDEVAIPGGSADTPIARAAQAAVVARSGGQQWPRPRSCRIMTVANQKGGVGKTTTAVNLAASLAMHGSRVLVVDLDPQGNASTALDVDHHSGIGSVYNVLVEGQPLAAVISRVAGFKHLYCAPATIDLAGAEIELVPLVARESRLARAVGQFNANDLDYILIDCPPSLGLLTVNALVAAPEVLIPIQCEYYALEGLEQLLRTIELVRSHLNPQVAVTTILLTMYDGRTRLASQVADEVRQHFGDVVLRSVIPRSVRVSEAPSYGQSVMTYDPGSSGAQAYLEAAREVAFRNGQLAAS